MKDYTDLKARLRARAGKWVEERFGGIVWVLDDPDLPAEALAAIEELQQRPCPHVRSSGTTQWCELARTAPAPAAEPVAWRKDLNPPHGNWTLIWQADNPWPGQFHVSALYAAPQPAQAEPCCGEYATCLRACTPRGRWLAEQEHEEIADSASVCGRVAEADSRKVEPATSVKDTDCLNLFVAPVLAAACRMDWQQVILNGGPPCFHVEANGCFCLRAERWAGHQSDHDYVSLASLLVSMDPQPAQADEGRELLREALRQVITGADGSPTHGSLAQIARRALDKE